VSGEAWAALFGAIVGGLVTATVQWIVTPRVEKRVRSLERWEHDLVELGALLTQELWEARSEAKRAREGWETLHDVAEEKNLDTSSDRFIQLEKSEQRAFETAWKGYSRLIDVRIPWLIKRVQSRNIELTEQVARNWIVYRISKPMFFYFRWDEDQPRGADAEALWEKERKAFVALVETVERAAESVSPPGPTPRERVRRRWRKAKGRIGRRREKNSKSRPAESVNSPPA
jgi:hypothetical protein